MQLSVVTKDVSCLLTKFPSQAKSLSDVAVKQFQFLKIVQTALRFLVQNIKKKFFATANFSFSTNKIFELA